MHVYVHVPFCARRCSYCDFAIAVRKASPDADFLEALRAEWRLRRSVAAWDVWPSISTLYFGGGTPSRLEGDTIGRLIQMITADRPLASDAEVTLEANPDDVTPDRAIAWREAGVNRISLGVQSHEPAVLEWMHRTHTAQQVPFAVSILRNAGFDNISMDLIFGVPVALRRDWLRDFDLTLELEPTHISLYGLTVEPHTPLAHWTSRGEAAAIGDDRYATEFLQAHDLLVNQGFEHYEVSNAAKPGYRSRHNSAYWRGADYIGLGPSAHSLLHGIRSWNVREWAEYARLASRGEPLMAGDEALDG
ncbi:MAG: radical SAM family heme chaperone HemW, partial [Gemmatimonadales bacterium]|nr:radical SAM family heme chaperone HemW [Gemmatimonadales bacterium]